MQEAQQYIDNVARKLGTFEYHPLRTPLTHMDLYRRPGGAQSSGDVPVSAAIFYLHISSPRVNVAHVGVLRNAQLRTIHHLQYSML